MDDDSPRRTLAEAARAVNRASRVTQVDGATLAQAEALLREATALLETATFPGPHCQVGFEMTRPFDRGAAPHEFFPYSPAIGPLNPMAPPVQLEVQEDRTVRGTVTLHEGFCGPPWNLAHGGVIAMIFDELLGVAGIMAAGGGFTGRLTINYRKPTPILRPLELVAWLDRQEGRKLIAKGEIRVDGVVTADAEGLFIQVGGPLHDEPGATDAATPPGGG